MNPISSKGPPQHSFEVFEVFEELPQQFDDFLLVKFLNHKANEIEQHQQEVD